MRDSVEPTIAEALPVVSSPPPAQTQSFGQWWMSDWGPGPLIQLALPLMISTGFISLTLFTDRTLLYWKSEEAASAAMGAGSLYWTLTCFPMGLLGYVSAFVSQYIGAKRFERVPIAYRHAFRLAWMIVPLYLVAIAFAYLPFTLSGHAHDLAEMETTYLRTLLLGGIATLFYSAQSGLLTGVGRTGIVMMVDAASTLLNLVLDFVLIFGWWIFPELGVLGAAVATAISFWVKIPLIHYWMLRNPQMRELAFPHAVRLPTSGAARLGEPADDTGLPAQETGQRIAWEWPMIGRLITYGAPAGLHVLAESAAFSIIMLQVGQIGGLAMAATTLALGLNVLAFVPMMGLGIGVGVLVGKHLLEKRIDLAQRTVSCALVLSGIYTTSFAIMLGLFPDTMSMLYAIGSEERFEAMRPLLIPLLRIIALYCIIDGFQIVFVGAIKGAGDTWFVLFTTTTLSTMVVVTGLVCERWLGTSLLLWWYVIAGWVACMALAFGLRYAQGSWKRMQVIEKEPSLD